MIGPNNNSENTIGDTDQISLIYSKCVQEDDDVDKKFLALIYLINSLALINVSSSKLIPHVSVGDLNKKVWKTHLQIFEPVLIIRLALN